MQDRLDPELVAPLENIMAATGGGFSLLDIPATRAMVEAMVAAVKAEAPAIEGVDIIDRTVPSAESAVEVLVRIYRPTNARGDLPALVWMHPGGFVIGSIELDDLMIRQLVKDVGCVAVSVEYRLAPEHPFPAALNDSYGAFRWLVENSKELGVDQSRISVGGASAGGGLAASLCLMARDRGGVQPCHQLLVYPAINDYNIEQVSDSVPENLFWSRESTLIGWRAYLQGKEASKEVEPYAAPYRASDLSNLPPAYIPVGALDMFFSDVLDYGGRLIEAGVDTEVHVYPGAFHAFDAFAPTARVSQQFVADRNAALSRAFG